MEHKLCQIMMSPEQLLNQRSIEPSILNRGLKKQFPDEGSDEIVSRLQGLCKRDENEMKGSLKSICGLIADELLKNICCERIERTVARSQAEYNAVCGLVVVTRKLGKWNTFGYRTNNMICLNYYETLYLIDVNRLELYYDSILVSLEQAYTLLLNNKHDRKSLEKYFIYSNLSKAGYIVQPHREHIPNLDTPQFNDTVEISTADKCVWQCLFEELKQTTSSDDKQRDADDLYMKTKESMRIIGDAIKNQCIPKVMHIDQGMNDELQIWKNEAVKVTTKDCSRKRKMETLSLPSTSKKIPKLAECTSDRFLDVLHYERDFANFKAIFEDIQVIELEQVHIENIEDTQTIDGLEFDFDLYLNQPNFKQSNPGPPNYRIIIFKSMEPSPSRESIVKLYLQPAVPAPVLVFFINEFLRISAFLYRISL